VPGILAERGPSVAFTAVKTNGLGAAAYGVFALARRGQAYLLHLAFEFNSGLSRYLPNADDDVERDALVTLAFVVSTALAWDLLGRAIDDRSPSRARRGTLLAVAALGVATWAGFLAGPALAAGFPTE
jgi:hypothetical protein